MLEQEPEAETLQEPHFLRAFLVRDWPYIAMLMLAIVGVALASVVRGSMTAYWEILVPFFAAVCVFTRWRTAQHQLLHWRLIRIEALHWGAVLVAMNIVTMSGVSRMMNVNAVALMVLTILALGTFTAGAQIGAWRICLVGAVLALGVPLIAWLEQATLLLTLTSTALVAIAAFLFSHYRQHAEGSNSILQRR